MQKISSIYSRNKIFKESLIFRIKEIKIIKIYSLIIKLA